MAICGGFGYNLAYIDRSMEKLNFHGFSNGPDDVSNPAQICYCHAAVIMTVPSFEPPCAIARSYWFILMSHGYVATLLFIEIDGSWFCQFCLKHLVLQTEWWLVLLSIQLEPLQRGLVHIAVNSVRATTESSWTHCCQPS